MRIRAAGAAGAAAADARDIATMASAEDRGAGRVTSYTSTASVQGLRHRAAASVEDRSRRSCKLHSGGSGGIREPGGSKFV